MIAFGIVFMFIGSGLLIWSAFIGLDTGFSGMRVTNIAGLNAGAAFLVSGSVFLSVGLLKGYLELWAGIKTNSAAKSNPADEEVKQVVDESALEFSDESALEFPYEYKGATIDKRNEKYVVNQRDQKYFFNTFREAKRYLVSSQNT